MQPIVPPTNCPVCNSILEYKNDILYCLNIKCAARESKTLQHWAKTVRILGLGEATIKKLGITQIEELYSLSLDEIKNCLGSEKLAAKLYKEIENSKLAPLNITLAGFGIPLIGTTATEKLSKVLRNLDDLTIQKAEEAGLGPKAIDNLMSWFKEVYLIQYKFTLPLNFTFKTIKESEETKGVVCITGKLRTYKTKAEAEKALTSVGYKVSSNLTKSVTILVNESGIESTKTQKAGEAGITIITNIKQLLGE
jgi:DNA ligase (NAD+)